MISELMARGGGQYLNLTGDKQLVGTKLVRTIRATLGAVVKLPKATQFDFVGWPAQVIINIGSNTFTLADADGTTVRIISPGQAMVLALLSNATDAGEWVYQYDTLKGSGAA